MNWYVYVGNNPLRYIDPSGLENRPVQSINLMNQEGAPWLPLSVPGIEPIRLQGCSVALLSNIISTYTGRNVNPEHIADVKSDFNSDGLIWAGNKSATDAGLTGSRYETALTKESYDYINQKSEGQSVFFGVHVMAETENKYTHWVGVKGMTTRDGIDYYIASDTSKYDEVFGGQRLANGWDVDEETGQILIPVSKSDGYVMYTGDIKKDASKQKETWKKKSDAIIEENRRKAGVDKPEPPPKPEPPKSASDDSSSTEEGSSSGGFDLIQFFCDLFTGKD